MIIETDRLYLRRLKNLDIFALKKILQDEDVMYAYEHPFSDNEVDDWFNRQISRYGNDGFGLWAAVLKDNDEVIGQCGITMQSCYGGQVHEIDYLFQKAFWHKGYATEVAIGCKKYSFDILNCDEVFSIVRDTNIASQNVAKRNGMEFRGYLTKHYYNMDMLHYIFSVRR